MQNSSNETANSKQSVKGLDRKDEQKKNCFELVQEKLMDQYVGCSTRKEHKCYKNNA